MNKYHFSFCNGTKDDNFKKRYVEIIAHSAQKAIKIMNERYEHWGLVTSKEACDLDENGGTVILSEATIREIEMGDGYGRL